MPRGQFGFGFGPFTGRLLHSRALLTVSSLFAFRKVYLVAGGFVYLFGDTALCRICCAAAGMSFGHHKVVVMLINLVWWLR